MKTSQRIIASLLAVACAAVVHQAAADVLSGYNATLPLANVNAPVSFYGYSLDKVTTGGTTTTSFMTGDPNAGISPAGVGPVLNLGSFDIVISAGPTLAGNAAALAAFNRAAAAWEARFADPITITLNCDLAGLGAGILGSTSTVLLQAGYTTIRNQLVADSTAEGPDDAIVLALPTAAQFTATIPAGTTLSASLTASKASLKAAGFGGLDGSFGASDASITFSTNFGFDFDRSDGVGAGLYDFETVAEHEIGHALGFISDVDSLNGGATTAQAFTLDLFRFRNLAGSIPTNAAQFATFARNLVPGADDVMNDTGFLNGRLATGLANATFPGTDGNQASHWKADELTGIYVGIMDPTLAAQQVSLATENDFRAFDLIGYNIISAPEPSSLVLLLGGLGFAGMRRRRG